MTTTRAVGMAMVIVAATACDRTSQAASEEDAAPSAEEVRTGPPEAKAPSNKEARIAAIKTMKAFADKARADGLKFASPKVISEKKGNDPNKLIGRPGQYLAKMTWKVAGKDATIEVFPDADGAQRRAEYVEKIGEASPMFLQYVYVHPKRHAVLRIPHQVKPAEAEKWEASLLGI